MKAHTPDRPLHVLVYTDSAGIGGAEISLGHLVATASPHIQITVAGTSSLVVNHIVDRRPQADRIVLPDRGILKFFQHFLAFHHLRPDIIHINLCTPWAGAIGLTAALLLPGVRVVRVDQLPLRTTDTLTLWRTRSLSLRVDAHVAVGKASARRMEDFYALGRKSIISIPNGVPDPGISPVEQESSPQCNQLNQLNQTMVVGSIGRLDAMKAHDILVQAIAQVEGVRAVILGEGEQRTALEQLAEKLGVSDRVELVGWVNQPHSYLAGFDVVAMPSRSEGFPLAMVEAMLAGIPVIATRVGSMTEAIIDNQTGILIEKDDVSGLVEALQKLRDNPALRFRLGQQARAFAVAHFTVDAMTTKYEHLWQKIVTLPAKPRWFIPRPQD